MYSMGIPPTSGTLAGATSGGQPEAPFLQVCCEEHAAAAAGFTALGNK
jgi:hypothetical protein